MADAVSNENDVTLEGASPAPRKRILLISYLFPPAGGIAVQRALSLAKYLPGAGFEVRVLRAGNAAAPVRDIALTRQIPAEVTVHSAFIPEVPFWLRHTIWSWLSRRRQPSSGESTAPEKGKSSGPKEWLTGLIRRVLCPEPEVLWYPFALRQASRIIRRYQIDTVVVTAPPFSAFLIGNALKRRFPQITYVADFRDEWLSFYLKDFDFQNSDYTRRRAIQIERDTIESADLVVAVTESSLSEIRSRYPDQPDEKFTCVSNGFDPDAFKSYRPEPNREPKLVVTHVGTVYKTASPKFYLDALDDLPEDIRAQIETRFVGRISDGERRELEGRRSAVQVIGFLPQDQALQHMQRTDCLLLTMTNEISLPGKLYEYLAARKPIIALTPAGSELDRFMRQAKAGWGVDHRDSESIKRLLAMLSEQKTGTGQVENRIADDLFVQSYERPRLVRRYAQAMLAKHR
jgi:hypothetical protein